MKKILFVLNNMNIGGTEKAWLNLMDTISSKEYEVTLLLLEKTGGFLEFVPEWVQVQTLTDYERIKPEIMEPPLKIVKTCLKEKKIVRGLGIFMTHCWYKLTDDRTSYYKFVLRGTERKEKYDIAVAYAGPFDFLTVYVLFYIKAVQKIQWIHFDVSKFEFHTKQSRRLYPLFDQIYVVSEEARRSLVKKIPGISDKTKTFLNQVSVSKCRELADLEPGFEDDFKGSRILTVGRLSVEKGQDIIPEVAARLVQRGYHFRWYLIGDGKLRTRLEEKCRECGVEERVILLGTQANPYPYLKQTNLYVQTSIHEGYCISLAEARAFNLPIISTECAGAHEQLDDLEDCIVVERTVDEITDAIMRLLRR